jgi:hypothetical protein
MTMRHPQSRARQPKVPPMMAPVLLELLLLGAGPDWVVVVSEAVGYAGGAVLLGPVDWAACSGVEDAVFVGAVSKGFVDGAVEAVGRGEEVGFDVVVKAKYTSVLGPGPQARYVKGPTLLGRVKSAVEQKGSWSELAGC